MPSCTRGLPESAWHKPTPVEFPQIIFFVIGYTSSYNLRQTLSGTVVTLAAPKDNSGPLFSSILAQPVTIVFRGNLENSVDKLSGNTPEEMVY